MNPHELKQMHALTARLQELAAPLIEDGLRPELVVFLPHEVPRIAGYKVALVIPLAPGDDT